MLKEVFASSLHCVKSRIKNKTYIETNVKLVIPFRQLVHLLTHCKKHSFTYYGSYTNWHLSLISYASTIRWLSISYWHVMRHFNIKVDKKPCKRKRMCFKVMTLKGRLARGMEFDGIGIHHWSWPWKNWNGTWPTVINSDI